MSPDKVGRVLIVSGQSGVGKDTIINIITNRSDFSRLPSCTTRSPRPGEIDGVSYHFLTEEAFLAMHEEGKLIDHVVISDKHYGMPADHIIDAVNRGKDVVLHLVVGSAMLVKHLIPQAMLVFILPPSHEEQVSRMVGRGMSDEEVRIRLRDDPTPLTASRFYDFVVVNHNGEERDTAERVLQYVDSTTGSGAYARLRKGIEPYRIDYMFPQYFATGNQNKLREVNSILGKNLEHIELDLVEPQAVDVAEVVKDKARDAFEQTGKLVLVEDTSLEFACWNGLPGALVKWFMDSIGNEGILKMMANEDNRVATAKTAVAFFDGTTAQVFTGEVTGTIPTEIKGTSGFGWDPIFVPDGHTKSFAEMTPEEKNEVSMRRMALNKLNSHFGK
jgi:XTP/dITP diphosphohydrolase